MNIEICGEGTENDFSVLAAAEGDVSGVDEIEELVVSNICLDDAPAAGESLGKGRHLGHQPAPANSFGRRTRL